MSIHAPEGNDLSPTPEGDDQYCHGDFYFHLMNMLRKARPFTAQAYFPNKGGMKTITNQNTANGNVRIMEGNNLKEPDENDLMFFSREFLESIGIDWRRLKVRQTQDNYNPEKTGVYRKIDPDVLKRIMGEPPLDNKDHEKKAG